MQRRYERRPTRSRFWHWGPLIATVLLPVALFWDFALYTIAQSTAPATEDLPQHQAQAAILLIGAALHVAIALGSWFLPKQRSWTPLRTVLVIAMPVLAVLLLAFFFLMEIAMS